MLKARSVESGLDVLGWNADRKQAYVCPECQRSVVPHLGPKVIHHFAHCKYADCSFGVGESIRHMTMKAQIGRLAAAAASSTVIDYEVPLIQGRRADVVLNNQIVVECQVTPISVEALRERTADYSRAGYPVLWVWNNARLQVHDAKGDLRDDDDLGEFGLVPAVRRVPAEIRYVAARTTFVCVGFPNGQFHRCVFEAYAADCSYCDNTGERYGETCPACGGEGEVSRKTMRRLRFHAVPAQFSRFEAIRVNGLLLARIPI